MNQVKNILCRVECWIKHLALALAVIAVIYSLGFAPVMGQVARKSCHADALAAANAAVAQVQEYNKNLAEGQEPAQINDVAIYDTQYSLCVRSKGL